jgi:hypothetical protein
MEPVQRRRFLHAGLVGILGLLGTRSPLLASQDRFPKRFVHPEPRKGITGEKVVKTEDLEGDEKRIALFDGVRKIPEVVDGIGCRCGCAEQEGMYSLLSCYEVDSAMAKYCPVCQGEGALVVRLHGAGRTLDQIRKAIDARF